MNRVTLSGRLTRDPELRTTNGGKSVCSFNLAIDKKMSAEKLARGISYLADNQIVAPIENAKEIEVIYGRMDRAVPPVQTMKLREFLPNAEFKERPKAGHWPPQLLL